MSYTPGLPYRATSNTSRAKPNVWPEAIVVRCLREDQTRELRPRPLRKGIGRQVTVEERVAVEDVSGGRGGNRWFGWERDTRNRWALDSEREPSNVFTPEGPLFCTTYISKTLPVLPETVATVLFPARLR